MPKAFRGVLALLLCTGALSHVVAGWDVMMEEDHWSHIYNNVGGQPLDPSEPISVKIVGPKDADGYPTAEIYYNDIYACDENLYRYYPSFVYGVTGRGRGPSTSSYPVYAYSRLVVNSKTLGLDYGRIEGDDFTATLATQASTAGYNGAYDISFYGKCGSHKLGPTIKDVLKAAEASGYVRARLTIDQLRFRYPNDASDVRRAMWVDQDVDNDQWRRGRGYYYLYVSKPVTYSGYSCTSSNCPTEKGTYYFDRNNSSYDFKFDIEEPNYAPVKLVQQYRHYTLRANQYVAGSWQELASRSCQEHNDGYGFESGNICDSYHTRTITNNTFPQSEDSLVEFRVLGITTIAEGPSSAGAYAMKVYDTTYSDIIKLIPGYRIQIDPGKGRLLFNGKSNASVDVDQSIGTKNTVQVIPKDGYEFQCWTRTFPGLFPDCNSTENPMTFTVRGNTEWYAIIVKKPIAVTWNETSGSTESSLKQIYGRNGLVLSGTVSGADSIAHFAFEYRVGGNKGTWQRVGGLQTISALNMAVGTPFSIDIGKFGATEFYLNGTKLAEKNFAKGDSTEFRVVVAYDQDMITNNQTGSEYSINRSDIKSVKWLQPVTYYDNGSNRISDTAQVYGSTVIIPHKTALKIPADADGVHYDFDLVDQDGVKYDSKTKSIVLSKDSLIFTVRLAKSYDVKFVDVDGNVLKSTVVEAGGSVLPPESPAHIQMRFLGWDSEYWSDQDQAIVGVDKPIVVKASYEPLYTVYFVDILGFKILKEETLAYGESPTAAPAVPSHAGLVFKGWDMDWKKITQPEKGFDYVFVETIYTVSEKKDFDFTVTGLDEGSSKDDVQIKTPKCLTVEEKTFWQEGQVDSELKFVETDVIKLGKQAYLSARIVRSETDECADDVLANIWMFAMGDKTESQSYTVNGITHTISYFNPYMDCNLYVVEFVDKNGKTLKEELVLEGQSATAPKKVPDVEGYVFTGWDTDFSKIDIGMTINALYRPVEKNDSSEADSNKSSPAESDKKPSKSDAVITLSATQFTLMPMGRNIQVAGARVGLGYAVFDMQGHVIRQGRVETANFDIPVNNAGAYLVRIAGQSGVVKLR